jgi:putative ABC transport system permease protein
MRAALSFRLAYRHVRAGFGRVVLSVLALALGVALVVAVQLMNAAVLDSFLDTIDGMAGRAGLTVTAGEGVNFDEALVEQVAKVPGVNLAVPLVTGVAFPDDGSGELLTVHGVDVGNDSAVRVYHRGDTSKLVDDVIEFLNSKDSIVIGREFAVRRGLDVGSKLPLVTPTGVKTFTVRGLLDPEGLARTLGGRLVVMDVFAAELAFTARGQINQIDILVDPGREATVKEAVAAILPPGLKVEEPTLRKDIVRRTVAGFQAMLNAFAMLAAVAGFLVCYSRFAAIYEGRTWEIGLQRAVGLRRSIVFRELLKESLVLGAIGTAIGLPVGVWIGRIGLPTMATATAINFSLPVAVSTSRVDRVALVSGVAIGLIASLLAAIIPALRLARTQPIAALTLRGREAPLPTSGLRGWRTTVSMVGLALFLAMLQSTTGNELLGNLATVCGAIAICAMAGPLAANSVAGLAVIWHRLFGPAGKFAASRLSQRPRPTAFMIATIGIGLGVVYMLGAITESFEGTLIDRITARTRADLTITSAYLSGGYLSAPIGNDVREAVRSVPGVVAIASQERKDVPHARGTLAVDAWDPECFSDKRLCEWSLEDGAMSDALNLVESGEGALITGPLARQLKLAPGDQIDLQSPSGPQRFRIAAITRSDVASVLVVSRARYGPAWNDDMTTWLHVAVGSGADLTEVQAAIGRRLGIEQRLRIRTRAGFVDHLTDQARQAFQAFLPMKIVVFLLVLIGIGDTLATSVLERTREIGMMRAVGIRRGSVVAMVVLEASAIAILGLVLAVATGVALGTFWVNVQFPAVVGWTLDYHFPIEFVLVGAMLLLTLSVAGSLLPALRAAFMPVSVALRTD